MGIMSDEPAMRTIVQVMIYRVRGDRPDYLLLLRNDGGTPFWQPVSQDVEGQGTVVKVLETAMLAQAGIGQHKRLSQPIYTYEWYAHGQQGRDIVFAAEVDVETEVRVDGQTFTDHAWLPFAEAQQGLKWNGNKEALRILHSAVNAELESQARARAAAAAEAARLAEAEHQAMEAAAAEAARRARLAAEIREAVTSPVPLMYSQPQAQRPAPPPVPAKRPPGVVIPLPVYSGPNATPPPDVSNLPIAPAFSRLPRDPYQPPQKP